MGDAMKDKTKTKKLMKDSGKVKTTSSSTTNVGTPSGPVMASPAPIDNPAFDALHPIQKDWTQREWIEAVNSSMKRIVDFLNKFEVSTRFRLATLNQKLSALERQMDYLESQSSEDVGQPQGDAD